MKIRVLVNGAKGKMGKEVSLTLKKNPNFEVIAELDHEDNLQQALLAQKPDVVVDFTTAQSVSVNLQTIIDARVHPVVGTSGLLPEQITHFQNQCQSLQLGGIVAANFSMGAILMMRLAKETARFFSHAEIIEYHHEQKLDAPSQTAIRTAHLLEEAGDFSTTLCERETLKGSRGAKLQKIPIHAIRLPGLMAHQEIIFGSEGETLRIRHDTLNRSCFMKGICLACKKVMHLKTLYNGLDTLLFEEES